MKRLIFLAIIYYLLFTIYYSLSYGAILLDRVIAVVNEDAITWGELRRLIEQEGRGFIRGLGDKEREEALKGLEKTFLNNMIDIKLQLQEARRKGFDVKASEVEEAIAEIKKKFNLTEENFLASLKAEGFTHEEYKRKMREQILLSKVVNYEVRSNVLITEKEITDFYNVNKEVYEREESVRIRQIFFNAPEDKKEKARLEAKAQEIIKRLEAGQDFSRLAEEYSEDVSRRFGGDLGYISRGTVLKEIEDVTFAMKEGEISKPFWSPKGLHIIKVEHRLDPTNPEKIRDEIKGILFEKEFRAKYEEWIKDLRAKAHIEIKMSQ